jgi:hypothetical protein
MRISLCVEAEARQIDKQVQDAAVASHPERDKPEGHLQSLDGADERATWEVG